MKHSLKITLILLAVFFISQVIGLVVTNQYIVKRTVNETTGKVNIEYKTLPLDMERPQVEESQSYIFIVLAVIIGTLIVLALIRFRGYKVWKAWFFISVAICLSVAFAAFVPNIAAITLAIIVAAWKTYKPNYIIHNLSEVFIYGGLAAIFVPIMNLLSATILLILISIYDMYAVWKSKHMVKMATFQAQSKVFAGLSIPYKIPKKKKKEEKEKKGQKVKKKKTKMTETAILGGGDIGFPLLFTGVVMKMAGFANALIITISVTIALFLLLFFAEKKKFYPAMPFVSAGCFIGYGIVWLLIM